MRRKLTAALACLASVSAWSQPLAIESASVEIIPAGASDVDDILAVERGVELVLCQAGVKPRLGGAAGRAELKLVASLKKADFETDAARCELTNAAAMLPGGATVALRDMATSRSAPGRRGRSVAEKFFIACGASFTRAALDALKDRIELRGAGCEAKPAMKKSLPRRR